MAEQSNLTVITKVRATGLMIPPGMQICAECSGVSPKTSCACQGAGYTRKE